MWEEEKFFSWRTNRSKWKENFHIRFSFNRMIRRRRPIIGEISFLFIFHRETSLSIGTRKSHTKVELVSRLLRSLSLLFSFLLFKQKMIQRVGLLYMISSSKRESAREKKTERARERIRSSFFLVHDDSLMCCSSTFRYWSACVPHDRLAHNVQLGHASSRCMCAIDRTRTSTNIKRLRKWPKQTKPKNRIFDVDHRFQSRSNILIDYSHINRHLFLI